MRKTAGVISALLLLALALNLVGGIEIWGYSGNDGAWTAPESDAETDQHPTAKLDPGIGGVGLSDTITQRKSAGDAPLNSSLRVGSILPLTGALSAFGPLMRDAADLAADEINTTGALTGSLELLHTDSETDPVAAIVAAAELVFTEEVAVIIGAAGSRMSEAVAEVTVPNEVVQISPSSTHPLFSTFEPEEPGWFWRTAASDALEGRAAAIRAIERDWTEVGILVMDNPWQVGAADAFREHFTGNGRSVLVQVNYTEGQPDYTSDLQLIANAAPQAVFFIGFPGDGLTIMQTWWTNRAQPGWGWDWLLSGGLRSTPFMSDLQGRGIDVTGVEGTSPILDGPNYATFRARFLARYDEEPTPFTAHTYDALYLTALAAVAGQGVDSVGIRDNLIAVANPPGAVVGPGPQEFERAVGILEAGGDINYEGASGLVNFDPVGDVGGSYEIWRVSPTYTIVQVDVIPEQVMWPGLRIIGPWFGSDMDAFLPVLDAFEVETGILTEYSPIRVEDLRPILDQQFALGEAPADVIFMSPFDIRRASRDGHIVHVNNMIDEADFRRGALDEVQVGSTIYGSAYTGAVKPGFWYKKSTFEANGWNQNPTTYAEFVALLDTIVADGMTPLVTGNGLGWPLSDITEHFIATYGGAQMHRDLTAGTLSWEDPSVRAIFTDRLVPLLTAGYFDTPVEWTVGIQDVINDKNALYFQGSWLPTIFPDLHDPNDWRVMALPGGVVNQGIVSAVNYLFLPAYTGVLGEAKLLFQFLSSVEGQGIRVQQGGHVATALGVPLDDYPVGWERGVAADMAGKEVLPDLDDVLGGDFQWAFWSQLQGLWTSSDPGLNLDAVLEVLQSLAPTPSSNTPPVASFTVSPSAGNVTTTFTLDASPSSDLENPLWALEVRWDWKDDGVWDTLWSATKLATQQYTDSGTYTIHMEVRDEDGFTDQTTRQVVVTDRPPVASFTVSPFAGNATTTFTLDASPSSGPEGVIVDLEVRWDWEDDGIWDTAWTNIRTAEHQYASPGTYTIRLQVRDAGGLTDETTKQVVVDIAPPATTASQSGTAGQAGWFRSSVGVTLIAVDALIGVASTSYRIDGGAWAEYASPFTVDGDGLHTVEYHSTDSVGNAEAVKSLDVKIDATAPVTSFNFEGALGENDWYVSTVTVTLSASDATSGLSSLAYRIDSGAWQTYTGPFTVDRGEHTLEYRATDAAGNEGAVTSPLKIDMEKPTIAIDSPVGGATLASTSVTLAGTAADDLALDKVELSTDETIWVLATGTTSWSGTLTLNEGPNAVYARATDAAGHTETVSLTVTVEISALPISPMVTLIAGVVVVAAGASLFALLLWRRAREKRKG